MKYLYFVRVGNLVKVGCTKYPGTRVQQLLGKRRPIGHFMGCVAGDFVDEKEVHEAMGSRFGFPAKGKEWFKASAKFNPLSVVGGPLLGWSGIKDIRQACKPRVVRPKKKPAESEETTRMTFIIDRYTARVIKQRAKESPYYLPTYIAELVRRGLVNDRTAR